MDDNTEQYSLVISAQDQATATLDKINASMEQLSAITLQGADAAGAAYVQYDSLAAAAASLGLSADQVSALTEQTQGLTDQASAAVDQEERLTEQTLALSDAYDQAAKSLDNYSASRLGANDVNYSDEDGGGGFNPSALTTAGRIVGGPGGRALRTVGQVSRLANALPDDSELLLELGSAALIAAPALVGVELAMHQLQDELKEDKGELDTAITGLHTFYQALGQSETTQQVTQQIEQLNHQRDAEAEELARIQVQQREAFNQASSTFGDLGARLLDTQTPVAQLRGEAEKLQTQLDADTASVKALTDGVTANAFAASDAAAKEKERLAQEVSGSEANVGFQLEAQRLTAEQRKQREFELQQEIAIRTAPANTAYLKGQPQAEVDAFNEQTQRLQSELRDLQNVTKSQADAIAEAGARTAATTDQIKAYSDAIALEGAISEKIVATETDIAKTRQDAADKATQLQLDYFAKDDEATRQADEKLLNIAENTAEKRARIERDFAASDLQAIGERDAYADLKARTKEQQQLIDAQVADKKAEDLALDAEQKAYRADGAAYQKAQAQLETALAKELATEEHTLQQEHAALTKAQYDQNAIALAGSNNILTIHTDMYTGLEIAAYHAGSSVVGQFLGGVQGGLSSLHIDGASQTFAAAPLPAQSGVAYVSGVSAHFVPAPLPPPSNGGTQGAQQVNHYSINGIGMSLGEVLNHAMMLSDLFLRG